MKIPSARLAKFPGSVMVTPAVLALTLSLVACGSSSSSSGTGGGPGTGGGLASTGGKSGGTGGAGGAVAGTGGAALPDFYHPFDTTTESFILNDYPDISQLNLAGTYPGTDGGTDAAVGDGGAPFTKPTLVFDSTVGSPAPGSLKVSVTFTDYNQYVDVVLNLPAPLDLTGKTVHGKLQRTSGEFSGGAQLHVTTGANYDTYVSFPFAIPPTPGTFSNAMLDLTTVAPPPPMPPVNAAMVRQVGVQIFSGSPVGTTAYVNAGVPVVFNIDTITD